jgi:hypothetical protein
LEGRAVKRWRVHRGVRVYGLSQEAAELVSIEAVTTDDCAVQQQDRDVESVTALQNGVAVDVNDLDWRQRELAAQSL